MTSALSALIFAVNRPHWGIVREIAPQGAQIRPLASPESHHCILLLHDQLHLLMTPDIHLYDGDVFLDATWLLKASTRTLTLIWGIPGMA